MLKKRYKALVTDFDLTVADTADSIASGLLDNAEYFGYHLKYEDMLRGIGCLARVIYTRAGVEDPATAQAMDDRYSAEYNEYSIARTKLFPDVPGGLEALRAAGIKTAVFSQKMHESIEEALRRLGAEHLFDCIVGYKDVKETKPAPEGMRLIEQTLGVTPDEVLYVGDALTDQQTAENAGVDFAVILTGFTPAEAFDPAKNVGVCAHFGDLCRELLGQE